LSPLLLVHPDSRTIVRGGSPLVFACPSRLSYDRTEGVGQAPCPSRFSYDRTGGGPTCICLPLSTTVRSYGGGRAGTLSIPISCDRARGVPTCIYLSFPTTVRSYGGGRASTLSYPHPVSSREKTVIDTGWVSPAAYHLYTLVVWGGALLLTLVCTVSSDLRRMVSLGGQRSSSQGVPLDVGSAQRHTAQSVGPTASGAALASGDTPSSGASH
jgi:hypothetical protein